MSEKKTAGLFDIRTVIGSLLGVYGVILFLTWVFGGGGAAGTNPDDNLWVGIILFGVGLVFVGWARLRPIVVEESSKKE
ncbi:MAG: hypothetical protein QM638_16315 [Nocardioides sp.]|uniref:hypothetical protein n=1 Tax=Nocardioides sp. TaxID=35761 RepID=UPI0039E65E10